MINLPHIKQNRTVDADGENNTIDQLSLLEPHVQNLVVNGAVMAEITDYRAPYMPRRMPKAMSNKGFSHINNIAKTDRCPYGTTTIYKAIKDGRIKPEFVKPGTPANRHKRIHVEEAVKALKKTVKFTKNNKSKIKIKSSRRAEFAFISEERFIRECKKLGTDEVLDRLIKADKQNINEN
jgi:hypothetical protein